MVLAIKVGRKPGSKAAMKMALQSAHDYFQFAEHYLSEVGKWPMPIADTVREVNYALGLPEVVEDGYITVTGNWKVSA